MDRFFGIREAGSSVCKEVMAGVASFCTASFILAVNPVLLGKPDALNISPKDVMIATATTSAIATFLVGILANRPFVIVPAMGINAYFAVMTNEGQHAPQAMGALVISGIILFLLAASGGLRRFGELIPASLRTATVAGIGLFIAQVGLSGAGFISDGSLGDMSSGVVWLFIAGFFVLTILIKYQVKAAMLIIIISVTVISWLAKLSEHPTKVAEAPKFNHTFGDVSFRNWNQTTGVGLATLIYTDLLVQPACVLALMSLPELQRQLHKRKSLGSTSGSNSREGGTAAARIGGASPTTGGLEIPDDAWRVWAVTGAVNILAGLMGASPMCAVMESAVGIKAGGRTGFTAVVAAILFALSTVLAPVLASFPPEATGCPLVLVGFFMMAGVEKIDWRDPSVAAPAFITMVLIPATSNVAYGVFAGLATSLVLWLPSKLLACCGYDGGENADKDEDADEDGGVADSGLAAEMEMAVEMGGVSTKEQGGTSNHNNGNEHGVGNASDGNEGDASSSASPRSAQAADNTRTWTAV